MAPTTLAKKIETATHTWHRRVICRACTRLCLACVPVSIFLARVVATFNSQNRICHRRFKSGMRLFLSKQNLHGKHDVSAPQQLGVRAIHTSHGSPNKNTEGMPGSPKFISPPYTGVNQVYISTKWFYETNSSNTCACTLYWSVKI